MRLRTDSAISMRLLIGRRSKKYVKQPNANNNTNCNEKLKTVNNTLITNTRKALAILIQKVGYGNVHLEKVKGHSADQWNHVADLLAARGRAGHANTNDDTAVAAVQAALRAQPPKDIT